MSILVIIRRKFNLINFIKHNKLIFFYLFYCGISIIWSEYQWISLKRDFKTMECILVLLVMLSESNPFDVFSVVLRRVAYILIPLSICFIKYFPNIGRLYSIWTGGVIYTGVTNNKNTLGRLCMVCAIIFFFSIINEWKNRKAVQSKKYILSLFSIFIMSMWLLYISNSVTSFIAFIAGAIIIVISKFPIFKQNTKYVGISIILSIGIFLVLNYAFDIVEMIITSAGRNITLTDRTKLWAVLLEMKINPWIGTGYESFWLGPRFDFISEIFQVGPKRSA